MRAAGQTSGICVLVADDDPVSLRFLELALRELGSDVCAVADGVSALAAASASTFDLLILDRRMPGLGAAALLRALRRQGVSTRAIATSAELDESARAELEAAGFSLALSKPLRLDDLAAAIGDTSENQPTKIIPHARMPPLTAAAPLLDDVAGLAVVGGERTSLRALRLLLAQDLESMTHTPQPPGTALAEQLHRLRAACRYCGATKLGEIATGVEASIRAGEPADARAWARLIACCEDTRRAIAQHSSSG